MLDLARRLNDLGSFDEIFMISSLKRTGVQDLIQYLESNARQRPWQMADSESSHNYETFAVELVKEQVYRRLNAEIPYVLEIKPVSCKFLRDGSLRIEQDLMVDHVKKKKIVVGKRGQAIGQIGCRARTELQRQLKLTVHREPQSKCETVVYLRRRRVNALVPHLARLPLRLPHWSRPERRSRDTAGS